MPQVEITPKAQDDIVRLHRFLATRDDKAAGRTVGAILVRLRQLSTNPAIGRYVEECEGMRELVVPFGSSGYVALYRFDDVRDVAIILAIRHQYEAGYQGIS